MAIACDSETLLWRLNGGVWLEDECMNVGLRACDSEMFLLRPWGGEYG